MKTRSVVKKSSYGSGNICVKEIKESIILRGIVNLKKGERNIMLKRFAIYKINPILR